MPQYRCYFIQKDGSPAAWRSLHSDDEGAAHDHALGLLVAYPDADKVEVWDRTKLILRYSRSDLQTPTELRRLCYLALAAAKKETDPKLKVAIASHAVELAQEAEALERRAN